MKHTLSLIVIAVGLCFLSSDWCSGQGIDTNGLVSSVRLVNGEPALFVNGRQKSSILAAPYRQGPRDFNTLRAGGIEIFNFYLRFPWTGPDQWDFSRPDAKLDEYPVGMMAHRPGCSGVGLIRPFPLRSIDGSPTN